MGLQSDIFLPLYLHQGGGLEALTERFQPQQATPPLMMEQKPGMYPQPYSSASPTTNLPGAFPGMVRQKPSFGPMPVQVPPPRGAFPTNMAMQPRQTLNRPPTAPNQLRLQLQQRLQGQQQVILPPPHPRAVGSGMEGSSLLPAARASQSEGIGWVGSSCIGVLKVSLDCGFFFSPPADPSKPASDPQPVCSQFPGGHQHAGGDAAADHAAGKRDAARSSSWQKLGVDPSLSAQPGSLLSVINGREKSSRVWGGGCKTSCCGVFFGLPLIPAPPPA